MKQKNLIPRTFLVLVVLGVLVSLIGGMPATAAQKVQSYIIKATTTDVAAELVIKHGGTVTSRLEIIQSVGASLSDQAVAGLKLEEAIVSVVPNGAIKSSDDDKPGDDDDDKENKKTSNVEEKNREKGVTTTDYPDVVGADLVWAQGVTGSGVTVAVLDTGIADMPGLTKDANKKSKRIVAWIDYVEASRKPIDPNGHGTHVAGIIANSEKGADGDWNGIAPNVKLAGVRVLDETGYGTYESVIQGLQWVLENKDKYNIRIVNLSLVAPVQSPYWADPLNEAVTRVWASGLTVIVAAGNEGDEPMSITVPGNNPYVVTIGAFTDNFTPADWNDDYITPFSGAGPTLDGFVKPDLVAPGGHITSLIPKDSVLVEQYPNNWIKKSYFNLAGTSQATAVVSGVAALMISNNPALTPNEVKARLTATALPWVDAETEEALYSMWEQGAGMVNAPDAVFTEVDAIANDGMDIEADLAGSIHYEGYSYFDEVSGTFRLYDPYADWDGGYGVWDGARGTWAGARGTWAGDLGAWASARGTWAGARGTWAGARGTWAGARGTWAGARGTWAGGYSAWAGARGTWAGARGTWAGARGTWAGTITDPIFLENYAAGLAPDTSTANMSTSFFIEDK